MVFEIYLDPTHKVLRLTFISPILDPKSMEEMYIHLKDITSHSGPYAVIHDFSAVTSTTLTVNQIRQYARRDVPIPLGRPFVAVAKEPNIFGLTKVFTIWCENYTGQIFDVVSTLEEAYELVGARPEEFTVHLFP